MQAFKFAIYVALPIGLTAAVVLNQDMLQRIIKSVSGLGAGPGHVGRLCCCNRAHPSSPARLPHVQRSYVTYPPSDVTDEKIQEVRRARRRRQAIAATPAVAAAQLAACRVPKLIARPNPTCNAAPSQGAGPQVLRGQQGLQRSHPPAAAVGAVKASSAPVHRGLTSRSALWQQQQ